MNFSSSQEAPVKTSATKLSGDVEGGRKTLDERCGLTSASAAQRHSLCPGSYLLERDQPEIPSPDAESGTRIHEALAAFSPAGLSPEEAETYQMCADMDRAGAETWGVGNVRNCVVEERLWHHWWKHGEGQLSHSGKPDRVYFSEGKRARIVDFKTGRNEPPESSRNKQLRDLAVLVWKNYPIIDEITVEIIQPWVTRTPSPCVYHLRDLERAAKEMEARVEASHRGGPRTPSIEACRWCRACAICPEFMAAGMPPATVSRDLGKVPWIEASIARLTGDQLGQFLPMVRLCAEVAEAEVRARIAADPNGVAGWKLSPGRITEKIIDPQTVFTRFVALGGTQDAFLKTVSVGKGKLENALCDVTGAKGVALKNEVARVIEGATEAKQGAEMLERDNGNH